MATVESKLKENQDFRLVKTEFENKIEREVIEIQNTVDAVQTLSQAPGSYVWRPSLINCAEKKAIKKARRKRGAKFKIALAGFNFVANHRHQDCLFEARHSVGNPYVTFTPKREFEWQKYFDGLQSLVQQAIQQESNILCLPEFNHQYPDNQILAECAQYSECINNVYDIIEQSDIEIVMIPGSGHCLRRFKNMAPIYAKGLRSFSVAALDDADETSYAHRKPGEFFDNFEKYSYSKRRPAFKRIENVKVPMAYTFPIFGTKIGNIAVLICLDAADLSLVAAISGLNRKAAFEKSNKYKKIDFILIPAYSANMVIYNLAKALSAVVDALVCFVNWPKFEDSGIGSCEDIVTNEIFYGGHALSQTPTTVGSLNGEFYEVLRKVTVAHHINDESSQYGWSITQYEIPAEIEESIDFEADRAWLGTSTSRDTVAKPTEVEDI